jgi:hypothetical protein
VSPRYSCRQLLLGERFKRRADCSPALSRLMPGFFIVGSSAPSANGSTSTPSASVSRSRAVRPGIPAGFPAALAERRQPCGEGSRRSGVELPSCRVADGHFEHEEPPA